MRARFPGTAPESSTIEKDQTKGLPRRLACAAEVQRLLLVHVNPLSLADDPIGLAGVRKLFPRAEIGTDGMVIDV